MGPLITLTTDFGSGSPYIAALKGVLLGICPTARLVDLSHQIRPQDLHHAAYFLAEVVPNFPPETLHVVVVDPGVGSDRALLYVESPRGRLLVPDNGCWTHIDLPTPRVRRLSEPRFWRQPVSATFHGRDILAPVAGHLGQGTEPAELGPAVDTWVTLVPSRPHVDPATGDLVGQVAFIDDFGNLITDIRATDLPPPMETAAPPVVGLGAQTVKRWVRTYADAEPGTLVALLSSGGRLEVAVVQGRADQRLGAVVGTSVQVKGASRPGVHAFPG